MADPDPDQYNMMQKICRFLADCRQAWGDVTGHSQRLGENLPGPELPGTSFLERLRDSRVEMPEQCGRFFGCVDILAVALVVVLAMEGTSQDDKQLQIDGNEHDQSQGGGKSSSGDYAREQDDDLGDVKNHELPLVDSKGTSASIIEEPETSERGEVGTQRTVPEVIGASCHDCRAVCADCRAVARKAIRLLTECGYCGGEEHVVRSTDCRICGGVEHTHEAITRYRRDVPSRSDLDTGYTSGGGFEAAPQGESNEGRVLEESKLDESDIDFPTGNQVYWRERVLDILAPSLPPLPDLDRFSLFDDLEIMNTSIVNLVDSERSREGDGGVPTASTDQIMEGAASLEHERAHERSHRIQDGPHDDNSSSTSEAGPEVSAVVERARARKQGMDPLNENSSTSSEHQNRQLTHVVVAHLPASLPTPRLGASDYNSGSAGLGGHVLRSPGSLYNPASRYNSARRRPPYLPDYYYNNRASISSARRLYDYPGAFSHNGPDNSQFRPPLSGYDDVHELESQSSNSPSSTSSNTSPMTSSMSRTPTSSRPWLHTSYSLAHQERCRSRSRGRVLGRRRPRCGLMMIKALREDPACIPEEGKTTRQPGHEDKLFAPKRGDVILRHIVSPGRRLVEAYFPGLEEYLEDGDSLVRLKMDNMSYPTMLIVRAKAYLFLQGKWMYLGRHQHGVRKPKRERVLG